MRTLETLIRPNIRGLVPYSSARLEYSGSGGVFLDANENPYGKYNRYPDPLQRALKKEIAVIKCVDESQVFIGNGSDEVIDLCFRLFCIPGKDKAITFSPTYGMYDVAAAINDVQLIKIPLDSNFQMDVDALSNYGSDMNIKLLILCSPNNPTGNLLSGIESVLKTFPGIVLVDEAYVDFAETQSLTARLSECPNLIVAQTLSKAHGMAAIRVGMAFASQEIIEVFNKVKPPYNVSSVNQEEALRILRKREFAGYKDLLVGERERIAATIIAEQLADHVYPSDANFLLIRVGDANLVYLGLLEYGIITRNRNNVIENCIRVTIGAPEENDKLLRALRALK